MSKNNETNHVTQNGLLLFRRQAICCNIMPVSVRRALHGDDGHGQREYAAWKAKQQAKLEQ
ncbi:MAG: hypothetical protein ACLSB9_07640 [Hydrogeniiclostridium mannosilyticum]